VVDPPCVEHSAIAVTRSALENARAHDLATASLKVGTGKLPFPRLCGKDLSLCAGEPHISRSGDAGQCGGQNLSPIHLCSLRQSTLVSIARFDWHQL
jgi:hypothetical protein